MNSKFSIKGSASAGMLSAVIIFAGLLVYANYYAFAPASDQIEPALNVTETDVVADKVVTNEANDTPTKSSAIEPLAESADETALADVATTPTQRPVADVAVASAPPSASVQALAQGSEPASIEGTPSGAAPEVQKSLNIQPAVVSGHATSPGFRPDSDAVDWRGYQAQAGYLGAQQIHYMKSGQTGDYRQHGRALGDGEGEFNFSMRFQGRSRMNADANADSDWNADHNARGVSAQYQDYAYYPRFAYQGYRY